MTLPEEAVALVDSDRVEDLTAMTITRTKIVGLRDFTR
jgi:hypothetical protein